MKDSENIVEFPVPRQWTTPRFWIVYNPHGQLPRAHFFKHPSMGKAMAEAKRLAELHPKEIFFVLETVSAKQAAPPVADEIALITQPEGV